MFGPTVALPSLVYQRHFSVCQKSQDNEQRYVVLKGLVYSRKMIFHSFTSHHFVDSGILIRATVLRFHGETEIHPMGKHGGHRLQRETKQ